MNSEKPAAQVKFRFALPGELPPGKACDHHEREGVITLLVHPDHATADVLVDLERWHEDIAGSGRWHQKWTDDPNRLAPAERSPHRLATAVWLIKGRPQMGTRTCRLFEQPGAVTWWIREGEMSQQLVDELNAWMDVIVGGGLWIQDWPADND